MAFSAKKPPARNSKINWSNPITHGLKFFASVHEGYPVEYVRGQIGTPQSSWRGITPAPDGILGSVCIEADGPSHSILFPKQDATFNGLSEGTWMVYVFHSPNTVTDDQIVFGYTGTGNDAFYMRMGTTGYSTRIWTTLPSDPTSNESSVSKATYGINDEERHIWGGTWGNNTLTSRVDRYKDSAPTTTSGVLTTVDTNANNVPRLGYGNNGGIGAWDGWLTYAAFWNRELSDSEWNEMVVNPWLVFEKPRQFALVTVVGGPTTINESISFNLFATTTQVNIKSTATSQDFTIDLTQQESNIKSISDSQAFTIDLTQQESNIKSISDSQAFTIDLTQTETGEVTSGTTTLTITLVDTDGTPLANLSGLTWAWFDESTVNSATTPPDTGTGATTDSGGVFSVNLPNTTLTSGQIGMLALQDSTGHIYALYRITLA